jgi:hypothetical protein
MLREDPGGPMHSPEIEAKNESARQAGIKKSAEIPRTKAGLQHLAPIFIASGT